MIYFAGWKEHYSLYPVNERVLEALGCDPAEFQLSKGTIRFSYEKRTARPRAKRAKKRTER